MSAAALGPRLPHDALQPRDAGRLGLGAALALLAHGGLIAALALGLNWRLPATPPVVSAELWAAVPRAAAPAAEAPPPPPPLPAPVPAPAPPPPPAPERRAEPPPAPTVPSRDAEIALEKEKEKARREAEALRERQEAAERARKAAAAEAERQKQLERQKQAEREKQARLDEQKRQAEETAQKKAKAQAEAKAAEKKKAEEAAKQKAADEARAAKEAKEAKAEEERVARQREANLKRILGEAGGSGAPGSTGKAAQDAGPSAAYAGRIVARVKPNIKTSGDVTGNPVAEAEIRCAADGTVLGRRIVKSSGNAVWDEAVLRAIDLTAKLPLDDGKPPPATMTLVFRRQE